MIPTYSHYIRAFVARKGALEGHRPGEHHFVATYLVPRLFAIHPAVPDYVNPDGMKAVQGDIVYFARGRHHFGIEIKYEQVRLTAREYNNWIVQQDQSKWPDVFIGICPDGLVVSDWPSFRNAYIGRATRAKPNWRPLEIASGYGPMCSVNALRTELPAASWFAVKPEARQALDAEDALLSSLTNHLQRLTSSGLNGANPA